jgi:hypothetical protein
VVGFRNSWALGAVAVIGCSAIPREEPRWPAAAPDPVRAAADVDDVTRIERLPVCVGSKRWSAGRLGDTVLYRYKRVGHRLEVGYFVYWSTERPWGDNVLSYTVVPALFIDLAYSHFFYLLPGMKDAMHGAADVEGVRVVLDDSDGAFRVVGGTADDGMHGGVQLSPEDLMDSQGRIVLLTDVWSHQLGAHGGGAFADDASRALKCYDGASLRPMTKEVAHAFRLGNEAAPRRAKPAWRTTLREAGTPG